LRVIRIEALTMAPEAYGSTYKETLKWPEERWRSLCTRGNYYLARSEAQVVGMASGGTSDQYPGTRWLYGLYVTASVRGTGVAAQLVEAVVEWAVQERASMLHLHVNDSAERAKTFYRKVGFEPTGGFVTMSRDPRIRLIEMVRNLD
jgi:GNAT superfamily N-acetyltransferase